MDAFKQRVIKQVTVDGTPTDTVLRPNARIEVRNGQPVRTIWAGGQRIAETTADVPTPSDAATFLFTDHQNQQVAAAVFEDLAGSPRMVGSSQVRRDPFGVELEGDDSLLSRGVSGGEQEVTGETYLGWRLYDAEVGRFLQADRLGSATAGMGQGLNRYRYGWNSPTNFTDPSGYSEEINAVAPMGRMAGMVGVEPRIGVMEGVSGISADGTGVRWGCVAGACFVQGSSAEANPDYVWNWQNGVLYKCSGVGSEYSCTAASTAERKQYEASGGSTGNSQDPATNDDLMTADPAAGGSSEDYFERAKQRAAHTVGGAASMGVTAIVVAADAANGPVPETSAGFQAFKTWLRKRLSPKKPTKLTKKEQLAANRAAGAAAELRAARELVEEGNKLLGSQVTVRTSQGNRRIDHLIQTPDGQIVAVEVKAGKAVRSKAQKAKDGALGSEGGMLVGKNAPDRLRGQVLVIQTIERVY